MTFPTDEDLFPRPFNKLETVHDLETRPRGGMVSSLFKVSDYLSQRGHDVWVLSDVKQGGTTSHGTNWVGWWPDDAQCDVLVCNRGINGFDLQAKHRVLWTHDLPHAGFYPEPKNAKAFSATVFMSKYAERIWRYYYKDIGRSFLIPNGVDKDVFYPREKDLNYLIYASAPNRGLKRLPFIFDCISEVKPSVYMRAYSNLSKLHPGEEEEYEKDYEEVKQSKVTLCDPIPQSSLAEELGKAG
jgi:glycosyltransferase involved in cell wall biosynthesis